MPSFNETRTVPYTVEQLYDLVLDIEKYPEFLPWCAAVRVHSRTEQEMVAEVVISFKAFSENYTSRITFKPPNNSEDATIAVEAISGPFAYLHNLWQFSRPSNETIVQFNIDFRFKSSLLERVMGMFFAKACEKMMAAFMARAEVLYGKNTDRKH